MASYRVVPGVIATQVEAGAKALLNTETGEFFTLDEVGNLIWEGLEKGQRLDEIAATICSLYDIKDQQARADIADFITQLLEGGLVTT